MDRTRQRGVDELMGIKIRNFESAPSWRNEMHSTDDFRFKSHQFLLELDAATTEMMMLVSSRETTGERWAQASQRHCAAYAAWNSFINESAQPLRNNPAAFE
jgi:hypothetical protein